MTSPVSYQNWLAQSSDSLTNVSDSPQLDARLLLCHTLGISQTTLLAWPDRVIPDELLPQLSECLERRLAGEPVAYILGSAEFWGIPLKVNSAVLIPRPETELLVETALKKLQSYSTEHPQILDLGTGSGAIAIALATELVDSNITAVDVSEKALTVARENAQQQQLTNIDFRASNWFGGLDKESRFDIIVSNPPYVAENDPHLDELTYEPDIALTSADDGLADIQHLIMVSSEYLSEGGWLMIEHGYQQGSALRQLFADNGYLNIETLYDLAKLERITIAQIKSESGI